MIIRTIDQSGYEISIPVYVSDTGYVMYGKGYGFKKQGRIRKPDKSAQVHSALSHFEQEAFVKPDSPIKTFMTLDRLMEANFKSSLKNLVTHFNSCCETYYKLLMNPDGTTKPNFHVPKTFYKHIEEGGRICSEIHDAFKHKNKTTILAQTGNVNTLLQNQSQGKKYSKPILDVIWEAYKQYCKLTEHLVQHIYDINHYPILKFCPKTGFLLAPEPTTNRNMVYRNEWKKFYEASNTESLAQLKWKDVEKHFQKKFGKRWKVIEYGSNNKTISICHSEEEAKRAVARLQKEEQQKPRNNNKKQFNYELTATLPRETHQLFKKEYKEGRLDWFYATHDLEIVIYHNNKVQPLPIKIKRP